MAKKKKMSKNNKKKEKKTRRISSINFNDLEPIIPAMCKNIDDYLLSHKDMEKYIYKDPSKRIKIKDQSILDMLDKEGGCIIAFNKEENKLTIPVCLSGNEQGISDSIVINDSKKKLKEHEVEIGSIHSHPRGAVNTLSSDDIEVFLGQKYYNNHFMFACVAGMQNDEPHIACYKVKNDYWKQLKDMSELQFVDEIKRLNIISNGLEYERGHDDIIGYVQDNKGQNLAIYPKHAELMHFEKTKDMLDDRFDLFEIVDYDCNKIDEIKKKDGVKNAKKEKK